MKSTHLEHLHLFFLINLAVYKLITDEQQMFFF